MSQQHKPTNQGGGGGGNQSFHTTQNDQDLNKLPPIRIRQESLYLYNTKPNANIQHVNYQFQNQRALQKDLIVISEKDIQVYEANNNQLSEYEANLKKYLKQARAIAQSTNGTYLLILLQDGDLVLFNAKERQISKIKGLQNLQTQIQQDTMQMFINDEATTVIVKQPGQDFIWMWNRSKEIVNLQPHQNLQSQGSPAPMPSKGTSMFRSNSYDKRFQNQRKPLADTAKVNQAIDNKGDSYIRGTWLKVFLSDLGGPFQNRHSSFNEAFDLKFVQNATTSKQEMVKVIQTKLYTKQEYFGNALRQSAKQLQDETMIIEISTQSLRMNYADKGGSQFEASQSPNNLKSKISVIDFIGQPGSQSQASQGQTLITKMDHSGQLAFTVLNSVHMLYCQVLFSNIDTNISVSIKLFDQVSPDDCPPFDTKGKTNLAIDDFAWTNNDAFVILVFRSSSIAILPRLGSSIVAIFNPTLINISQTMIDQFQHYQHPKNFNELIIPMNLQSKLQQLKHNPHSQKHLVMHPYEDSFLIFDKHLSYLFRLEFESELTDLFPKTPNMSFNFLRFCISMNKVASDPDILEKIPQLLTNKLPLFEFEKNAEADEEDDPGQVILTASQINPFEHGQKRMETNQSFNAEFTLDCQVVLVNLKHLLMGLRWNKDQPINYYQWLITVVNDCFFYFLKNSEPVYAFHALRLAEAYCKKALYVTETDHDPTSFQSRNNEHHSSRVDVNDFNYLKKFFEAVHDMYDYHNTKEYMAKTTSEKLQVKYEMLRKMPMRLTRGSGNWRFQFTKNYALLVYYSLIQFRNYQAANFNILFLVFACYIMQRYLDQMFFYHLQEIIEVVFRNFQLKKKSDDYELFLGKSGKNFLIRPPNKIKLYQDWVSRAMKFSLDHIQPMYEQENIENVMDTVIQEIEGNQEKVDKNITFLGEVQHLFANVQSLNQDNYTKVKDNICMLSNLITSLDGAKRNVTQFNISLSLYLLLESVRLNTLEGQNKSIKVLNLSQCIQNMIIATSFPHCTNFINSHTKIFADCFTNRCQVNNVQQESVVLGSFDCSDKDQLRQLLSTAYFYLNDIDKAVTVLKDTSTQNHLLKLLMLSSTIKAALRHLESMNHDPSQKEDQNFETQEQIIQFQQKANVFQTIRKALQVLKTSFYSMLTSHHKHGNKNLQLSQVVWAALSFLPPNARLIIKEQIGHGSLQKISKVLKFLKQTNVFSSQNSVFRKFKDPKHQDFKLTTALLNTMIGPDWTLLYSYVQPKIMDLLMESLELILVSLISQDDTKLIFEMKDSQIALVDEPKTSKTQQQEKSKNLSALLIKNYKKLVKILYYFKLLISRLSLETAFSTQVDLKILGKESTLTNTDKITYLTTLLKLSHFDKYQNNQADISKALTMIMGLISKDNQTLISEAVGLVKYQTLNRLNKQTMNQVLEKAKSQECPLLVSQVENILYSSVENSHLEKMLRGFEGEVIEVINTKLETRKLVEKGDQLLVNTKRLLFNNCLKLKKQFNLSFDETLYFDKANFMKKAGNIFGINEQMLEKFSLTLQKHSTTKEESKDSQHILDSFRSQQRGDSQSKTGSSLYFESPVRASSKDTQTAFEISKSLMKGRQFGGATTPKGPKQIDIQGNLNLLKDGGIKMVMRDKIRMMEQQNNQSLSKRSESIEFDNREHNFVKIQKFTKRKNSVRRQFILLQNISMAGNENNVVQKKPSHKKNFSLNAQGGIQLRNQRLLEGSTQQQHSQKPSPQIPPGLPKATHISKRQVSKQVSPQKIKEEEKSNKPPQNDRKQEGIKTLITNQFLHEVLNKWKAFSIQKSKNRRINWSGQKEEPQKSIKIKHSQNQSFNLLFVKFEGNNYTVQNAREALKPQKPESQQPQKQQEPSMEQEPKQEIDPKQKRKLAQSLTTGQPFEMIRVRGQNESSQQNLEEEKESEMSQPQPKERSPGKRTHKPQKTMGNFKSKQQYQNFIQKFKQISEKIDKVQKEANKLNQEYSNLI